MLVYFVLIHVISWIGFLFGGEERSTKLHEFARTKTEGQSVRG